LETPGYTLRIITIHSAANRFFQTFNQNMIIKWFAQETNRTSFDRLVSLAVIGKSGNEQDWYLVHICIQPLLQIQTAKAWHLKIGDYAGSVIDNSGT
jgi:hypothetical protein